MGKRNPGFCSSESLVSLGLENEILKAIILQLKNKF